MSPERPEITYDECYRKPLDERKQIFGRITAENRATLVKTHAERWLEASRSRLTYEQTQVVKRMISSISPRWYATDRDSAEIELEVDAVVRELGEVLDPEDVQQLTAPRAAYIPIRQSTE